MSATSSKSQSISSTAVPADSSAEIEASCRLPLLLLFISAALWLTAGSLLGLLASLKFHAPGMLADCPWFTYGRVHPAATNAFIYGFAMPAGLGVMLWLICQIGRVKLSAALAVVIGWLLWNLGVTLGLLGILYGESTGYEWLEIPRYGEVFMFVGYLAVGFSALLTLHQRAERSLSISLWFIIAALFWFPWIHSTAILLLLLRPVRGTTQSVIDWWYSNNLVNVWLVLVGLAMIFYYVPKTAKRPLYSRPLGLLTFWTIITFASWGAIPGSAPVPRWLPALSSFGGLMTIIPILAVIVNILGTVCGCDGKEKPSTICLFMMFGTGAYVVAGLLGVVTSFSEVSVVTDFTWFIPARLNLMIYGFFAMTMLGAIYHIVPQLLQTELSASRVHWSFLAAAAGITIYFVPLAIGGIKQGFAMNDASVPFLDLSNSSLIFQHISTLGDLLMLGGHLLLLLNIFGALAHVGKGCVVAGLAGLTKNAEVAS